HIFRQRRTDAVYINLVGGKSFWLQEKLMPVFLRKPNALIFNARAIAWPYAADVAAVHGAAVQVGPYYLVRTFVSICDVTGNLGLRYAARGIAERLRRIIARLLLQRAPVNGTLIQPWRRARLQATRLKAQIQETC